MPERQWSEIMIGECEVVPKGARDDLVDTMMQTLWNARSTLVAGAARCKEVGGASHRLGGRLKINSDPDCPLRRW